MEIAHAASNLKGKESNIGEKEAIDPIPEKAVGDYYKILGDLPVVKKTPDRDVARTTTISCLIKAKRQLDASLRALQTARDNLSQDDGANIERWEDLSRRQYYLRDSFIKFHMFVKENHEKRERALEKINKEKEIQHRLQEKIVTAENQIEMNKALETELETQVAEHQVYKDFLEKVVKKWPDAADIVEVLHRYETLSSVRANLSSQQAEALATVQTARMDITSKAGQQAQLLLGLQTQLADLRVKHQEASFQVSKWSTVLSRIRVFVAEKAVEIEQVRSSCLDLYRSICKLQKQPMTVADDDTEGHLTQIAKHIMTLRKAIVIVKQKLRKSTLVTSTVISSSNQIKPT